MATNVLRKLPFMCTPARECLIRLSSSAPHHPWFIIIFLFCILKYHKSPLEAAQAQVSPKLLLITSPSSCPHSWRQHVPSQPYHTSIRTQSHRPVNGLLNSPLSQRRCLPFTTLGSKVFSASISSMYHFAPCNQWYPPLVSRQLSSPTVSSLLSLPPLVSSPTIGLPLTILSEVSPSSLYQRSPPHHSTKGLLFTILPEVSFPSWNDTLSCGLICILHAITH